MPRTVDALLIEAEEWQAVVELVCELNAALGGVGDDATSGAVNAVGAIARGDLLGVVESQGSALQRILERVVEVQPALLRLVKVAGDRVSTLRVEAAELRRELEQ